MTPIASITTREYSSGSCILRVTGQLSPLSQVADKPVMVRSRFNLQLLPEDELDDPIPSSADAALPPRLELSGKAQQFSVLAATVNRYVQSQLTLANATGLSASVGGTPGGISLQPLGLTRHRLSLPSDFRPNQGSSVEISALELADLADVLEQADCDLYLPTEEDLPKRRSSRPKLPIWIGSAAAVGIAAILGSQWLSLQTPLTNLPTATSEGDIALEDNQELESLSQAPAPEPAGAPPGAAESFDGPIADTAEGQQPSAAPETAVGSVPSGDVQPRPGASPNPTPPRSESVESPTGVRSPAPESRAVTPRPQTRTEPVTPETATSGQDQRSAAAGDSSEPSVPAPSAARSEGFGEAEVFAEPAPQPESLSLPEASENEIAGSAPQQQAADQPAAAANALLSWQEQLRQQLQQNWTPLPNQSAPLRYRLTVNREGILQSIVPLSERSQQQQDTLNLPQTGDPVPQFPLGTVSVLEVQFLPSGEVIIIPITSPDPDAQ